MLARPRPPPAGSLPRDEHLLPPQPLSTPASAARFIKFLDSTVWRDAGEMWCGNSGGGRRHWRINLPCPQPLRRTSTEIYKGIKYFRYTSKLREGRWLVDGRRASLQGRGRRSLHEASTTDSLSGGPSWSGLYGPVLWLIFFQCLSRTILEGIVRENLLGLPLWRYDHPGF